MPCVSGDCHTSPQTTSIDVLNHTTAYQTIDSLVFFFIRSRTEPSVDTPGEGGGAESLPVLWHSALLAFCTRYRNDSMCPLARLPTT